MFQLGPCPRDAFSGDPIFRPNVKVDCGTLAVPENRSKPNSRTIRFAAAIVHAQSPHPKADPIVFLDGGPSFGAINQFALDVYFQGASYLNDRDVILVDTRGEGSSQPRLGCPELDTSDAFYSSPYVDAQRGPILDAGLRACRDRLTSQGIDLAGYTAEETAADLEALRKALGISQWNLWAISADGVAGLTYMRLYPGGIRSAVLDSPQSNTFKGGLDYVRGKSENLERIFAGCAGFPACNTAYPGLRAAFYAEVAALQRNPVAFHTTDFEGRPLTFNVDGVEYWHDAADDIFPGDAFEPSHIMDIVSRIWRSTHGELQQVLDEVLGGIDPTDFTDLYFAEGKTESYFCREIVSFLKQSDFERAAKDVSALAPQILAQYFDHPVGRAGCTIWNNGTADAAQHEPVKSSIPTLVTAGEFDNGVPSLIVRQIPATLSRSYYYEFPATGHLQMGSAVPASTCARAIAAQFLNAPTTRPDAGCLASLPKFDYTP